MYPDVRAPSAPEVSLTMAEIIRSAKERADFSKLKTAIPIPNLIEARRANREDQPPKRRRAA